MGPLCHWCQTMPAYKIVKISGCNVLLCRTHYKKYKNNKSYKILLKEYYENNSILQKKK